MSSTTCLPALDVQAERLAELGILGWAGMTAAVLQSAVAGSQESALLVVDSRLAPASRVAPLLRHRDKAGFVVTDMPDVDDFGPIAVVGAAPSAVYCVSGLDRGDALRNWSPDEALAELTAGGRTPLTLTEGLFWLLQCPDVLQRSHCFMTIGSRLPKGAQRYDARTPAIWISNGTGRDGTANRHAPKVGWCWAGNRHTWLGFASATERTALPAPAVSAG